MTITYWTGFSKRKNSTKRPSAGTTLTGVYLKEDTTILNPSLELVGVSAAANYFYISDFGRYYFVRNVTKVGADRNLFDLECDILATYKSQVGSYSGLIEYAADSTNIHLTDPRNKPQETFYETQTTLLDLTASPNFFNMGGEYIVAIAGGPGGVTHYVMDATQLQNFYNDIYSNPWQAFDPDFWNVKEAILSCKWTPHKPQRGIPIAIQIGSWTSISASPVTNRIKNISGASYNITFPSDSLIGPGYGTCYLDVAPFTTGTLYLPFVGVVPLDLDVVGQSKQVYIEAAIDNYTCDIVYLLRNDSGDYINTYQGNCGVDIPIVAQQRNMLTAASGALSLIGSIASGVSGAALMGPAAGLAAGLASGAGALANAAQSIGIHTQVNGSMSSAVAGELGLKAYATILTRKPTVETLTDYAATSGMPYFEVDTISNHAGYVQCFGASIDIGGTPEEKDTLNGYVNGGFYYE